MKIRMDFEATVINAKSEEYVKKNGEKGVLHSISFDADGECGTINCLEDVVAPAQNLKFKRAVLTAEYNDQYRSFRILALRPSKA